MKNIETLRSQIVGHKLKRVYRTIKPTDECWFEGLGNLLSYKYIMELDNGIKYEFNPDFLSIWENKQGIIELESTLKREYQDKIIIKVIIEKEFDGVYFKLANGMILYHNDDFGSELGYEPYSEMFDDSERLKD